MSVATSSTSGTSFDALSGSGDALIGMAALGKTAAALALVIAIILLCTAVLKRWQTARHHHGAHLRIVGNTAVGSRERIVVVEIEDTWLVVGVSGGRITKLHERPAPANRPSPPPAPETSSRFSQRLANALASSRKRDGQGSGASDSNHTP
ncbi:MULTISPECIES: flagellar biosynthetic protein FliO [Vreelandella]|uniref:Flagellar protein n=2 Tax=Vreelandella TaxID=3137766 RepID=A0A7C9NPN6_9GAMM|nr:MULTISPECIES: flagellar biosynthetic protein FliO [Halomonas]NDL72149.1 flagellar biosynthetic protein FliO [Halomonas alkaliphila]NYS46054.1 flagellar biosynthetic protein FliO [Halomonas zhaodongensis]